MKFLVVISALISAISCSHFQNQSATGSVTPSLTPSTSSPTTTPTSTPTANAKAAEDKTATTAATAKPAEPMKPKEVPAKPKESPLQPRGIDFGATIKEIAFASSANQDMAQAIWKTILDNHPDIFLFMGDNIDATKPEHKSMMEQYHKLDHIPEYRATREKIPFLATWDDLDFGQEHGGADFSGKETSKKVFLNYWTYVRDSLAMGQSGIYHAKIIGPKKKQVQFIMLDTRSFRSPLRKLEDANGNVSFTPNDDAKATVLGEEQWIWLEEQLRRPAQLRFIVSSIPLIATDHGIEKWANFPKERQRFFDLLKKTGARNVVVFSGDRHQGSIAKTSLKDWGTLYDVTASPINEPVATAEEDSSFEGKAYAGENFGLAQIDWHDKKMNLQIRDKDNKPVASVSLKMH